MGIEAQALRRLTQAWQTMVRGMKRINQSSTVLPPTAQEVFRIDENDHGGTDETVKVNCGPVVFNLCERANGFPNMYVVVEGWIRMESGDRHVPLLTTGFATRVGYFRLRGQRLVHVYGVHYDMDESGQGHPVFHAQLGTMKKFFAEVEQRFHLNAEVGDDRVKDVLRNVRTPTAQMDFFSVLTQLCADHLMSGRTDGQGTGCRCIR